MKRTPIVLSMWALLAPASGWTDEASPPHDPRTAHAATDRNRNGEINREEFEERITQNFYFADVDKDGFVTPGQLMAFDEALLFETADIDGDSRLSLSEFLAARFQDFREADTDGSDSLSVEEIVADFYQ